MTVTVPAAKVEVEFVAGVWTDVTQWVESDVAISRSRSSVFATVDSASCGFTLNNADGRFTPKRQVLADGVTTHPYYPNVAPKKRVRISYFKTSTRMRFVGRIKAWPPALDAGTWNRVTLEAQDESDRLSRVDLRSPITGEISAAGPVFWWPLTDVQGSPDADEATGLLVASRPLTVDQAGSGGSCTFGQDGAGYGDGTAPLFTPVDASNGRFLNGTIIENAALGGGISFEIWVNPSSLPAAGTKFGIANHINNATGNYWFLQLGETGAVNLGGAFVEFGTLTVAVGSWSHVAATFTAGTSTWQLWVNGVSAGTASDASVHDWTFLRLGHLSQIFSPSPSLWRGKLAHAAYYDRVLTNAEIAAHYAAGRGYYGDTTGARIDRFLAYAGLTTGLDTDAGEAVVNTYPQGGKSVLEACQDMAVTEGAGSVFYIAPDGSPRFRSRDFRAKQTTPVLTLDAEADLSWDEWAPRFADDDRVNDVTGNRAAFSGTLATRQVVDTNVALEDRTAESFDSYATTNDDVLYNAQDRLSRQTNPAFRLPTVTLDLNRTVTDWFTALASIEIGSVIRIVNIPPGALAGSQIDLAIEGWTETIGIGGTTYTVTFDTSPIGNIGLLDVPLQALVADRGLYDTARYQASATLSGAITSSATTVVIATSGATFSTTGGDYPMTIQIQEEQITLTGAPGGGTSPQTFTSCTRGVNGTPASAHGNAERVDLAPVDTYAL